MTYIHKNNNSSKWNVKVNLTDTFDLVPRIFYLLDKNIDMISKRNELQKILIDDYQLITFNEFTNISNLIIHNYDNNNKIIPIPKYEKQQYDGEYFINYEIKNKLPKKKIVATIQNDALNKFLMKENECKTTIINLDDLQNVNKKYDTILFRNKYDVNNCANEITNLPKTIKCVYHILEILNKGGDLYMNLNYYYHKPNIIFLQYILSLFDEIEYIENKLVQNKIGENMIKFINYSGKSPIELKKILDEYEMKNKSTSLIIINNYYCNLDQPNINDNNLVIQTLFSNDLDINFVTYMSNIYKNQNSHLKFLNKKVNYINYKKIDRHVNNLVEIAISWCNEHNIEINEVYKENKPVSQKIIKEYFKNEPGIDMTKIKMTSDALYSVTSPYAADKISKIIKNIMPNTQTIIDATANVGGNTLSFATFFQSVTAIEINKNTAEILKNNIEVYKRTNVKIINDDFLNLINTLSADVIFMDPPWSGTFYNMYKIMDLYLSDVNIIDILEKLNCKMIALKLPLNYNIPALLDKFWNVQLFKICNMLFVLIKKQNNDYNRNVSGHCLIR